MRTNKEHQWRHPGRLSSDYTRSLYRDHDRRNYSSMGNIGRGPKQYTSDQKIYDKVCEALFWNPDVDASEISVKVKDNFVYLDGTVDSRHAKKMAEKVIQNLPGVFDVFNRLTIKPKLDADSDKIITRGDEGFYTQESIQR